MSKQALLESQETNFDMILESPRKTPDGDLYQSDTNLTVSQQIV